MLPGIDTTAPAAACERAYSSLPSPHLFVQPQFQFTLIYLQINPNLGSIGDHFRCRSHALLNSICNQFINRERQKALHAPAALLVCVTTPWATVFVPSTVAVATVRAPEATVPPTERARALQWADCTMFRKHRPVKCTHCTTTRVLYLHDKSTITPQRVHLRVRPNFPNDFRATFGEYLWIGMMLDYEETE